MKLLSLMVLFSGFAAHADDFLCQISTSPGHTESNHMTSASPCFAGAEYYALAGYSPANVTITHADSATGKKVTIKATVTAE